MGLMTWIRTGAWQPREVTEAAPAAQPVAPPRAGFEYGIPMGGLTAEQQGVGQATQSDRRSLMTQLYESYLACPWSWASVNAISRTITAGGLVTDFDGDTGNGRRTPTKPEPVLALERLLEFCNPREDIRQLMRGLITDMLVFGDGFLEVVWLAGVPVALYSLDSPSMRIKADEHGTITGYAQVTDNGQRADFAPHEVIHVGLDSPRSGVWGISPTQANLLPITAWLFGAATAKEVFRKGNPPVVHVDFPASMSDTDIKRWKAQYAVTNLGPRNIGTPITTKGGGKVNELKVANIKEYLDFLDQKRDEIVAGYGVPPAEVGIIESGHLGAGTGESQRKTFVVNTCDPIAQAVLEKLQYHLAVRGFGVEGWHLKFGEVDLRDSKVLEDIRDTRVRNGTYTINRARAEIGEPPVPGGDDALIIDRQNLVLVRDLPAMSRALIQKNLKGSDMEIDDPQSDQGATLSKNEPAPVPAALAANAGVPPVPTVPPVPPASGAPPGAAESTIDREWRTVREAWDREYRTRKAQALAELVEAGR